MDREHLSLCFLKKEDSFLLINRNKPPFMGQWNAVGGHQIMGETMEECAKREIFEETKIRIDKVELIATFTWNYDDGLGFIYVADLPKDYDISNYPQKTDEGVLDFKSITWINHPKNTGIIADIQIFLSEIYQKKIKNVHYHLVYQGNQLQSVTCKNGLLLK